MKKSEQNIDQLIGIGDWSYDEAVGSGQLKVYPSRLWQYLACVGPAEAAYLGQSISVPLASGFKIIATGAEVFQAVKDTGRLPYPLASVHAIHRSGRTDASEGTDFHHFSFARLRFATSDFNVTASASEPLAPIKRDGPASADVQLRYEGSANGHSHFVEFNPSSGGGTFKDDETGYPKAIFPTMNPLDLAATGAPMCTIGPVDLPLEGPGQMPLGDNARDVFGRWTGPKAVQCALPAWAVSAPSLLSVEVNYSADGFAILRAKICWEWSIRTPYDIRLGVLVAAANDAALNSLRPSDGVRRPGLDPLPLSIRFNSDETPILHSTSAIPADATVHQLPDGHGSSGNLRTYLLRLPLGTVSDTFSIDPKVSVGLCADAWEKVSGWTDLRRSRSVSRITQLHDPRPPIITGTPWQLIWASRPNGAGVASARLPAPHISSGNIAGFVLWRANEAAVLDLAISEEFGDTTSGAAALAAILGERDVNVRLSQIQGLVERHLWKEAFLRAFVNLFEAADTQLQVGGCDVSISAAQAGLEFTMISAISDSGVASDKLQLKSLTAIAVPQVLHAMRPAIHVVTQDIAGTFARSGLCIAIIGASEGYSADDVRIFWSARDDIEDGAQLMTRLSPIKVLTRDEASRFVPEIAGLCARILMPNVYIYLMRPPQTWARQSWSADLQKADSKSPAEQVAGPRSPLHRCAIIPSRGPELRIEKRQDQSNATQWTLTVSGLFPDPPPGYEACEVAIDLADHSNADTVVTSGPKQMKEFATNGLTVVKDGRVLTASYDSSSSQIIVNFGHGSSDEFARIVAIDPVGRGCRIDLI